MKYLKKYKIFESLDDQFFKTEKEVKDWLSDMGITDYTINSDLSVDVHHDNLNISDRGLDYIPVQFNEVRGIFYCNNNNLKSLKGSPKYLIPSKYRTGFFCYENKLTSLEYCTPDIEYELNCSNNNIVNLKGFPNNVKEYDISENPINRLINRIQILIDDRRFELKKREFIYHLNDFDVIQKNNIFLDKLEDVIDLMGFYFDFKYSNKISKNFLGITKLGYNIID